MDLSTVNEGNEICGIIKTDIINTKKLRKHKTTFNQSIMPSVNKLITISFETKVQFSCSMRTTIICHEILQKLRSDKGPPFNSREFSLLTNMEYSTISH